MADYTQRPMTPEWRAKFEAFVADAEATLASLDARHPDVVREVGSIDGDLDVTRFWLAQGWYRGIAQEDEPAATA